MKNFHKKGLATVFGLIFMIALVIFPAAILYITVYRYNDAAKTAIRFEEERTQERIAITDLSTLNVSGTVYVTGVTVNNTGSIAVQIRAVYINDTFLYDPSTNATIRSSINPQDFISILLPMVPYNPITTIVVATDRGIKSMEYMGKFVEHGGSQGGAFKFYFGPLLLNFTKFYYSDYASYSSGNPVWRDGWLVDPTISKEIVWNITVTNIDDRNITINQYSCFSLVSNEGGSINTWYLEPPSGSTQFLPANQTRNIIYIWSTPGGTQFPSFGQGIGSDARTNKAFLTFFGIFHEHDGTIKPYGQTIPFEAVIYTKTGTLSLTAFPTFIPIGGTSTITAVARNKNNNLVSGANITFATDLGIISPTWAITNAQGSASVTLTAPATPGRATVTASWVNPYDSISITNTTTVLFGLPGPAILLSVAPTNGIIGTVVTISGSGFASNSQIMASFNGALVTLSGPTTTDGTGNIQPGVTFTVPASTAGDKTVAVMDQSFNYASAIFRVIPRISLNPTSGIVGRTVTVSGSGFDANSLITIRFDGVTVRTTTSTASGSIPGGVTFTVPPATIGVHSVSATDSSGNSATASFTVIPSITLNPTGGPVGSTVTVSGGGFAAISSIEIRFDGVVVASATSTSTGSIPAGVTFAVPTATAGSHPVSATDGLGNSASANFAVGPSITLNPTSGNVGTIVTVSGSGFAPGSTVTIRFDGTPLTSTLSTPTGTIPPGFTFTVPTAVAGVHTVTARDGSANQATTSFTIGSSLTLNPTSGNVGTTVTVSGSGFAGGSLITIRFDGVSVRTTTSTAGGAIPAGVTFTVPAATAGVHTVSATDVPGNTASAGFTVTTSIALSPTSGVVGSTVLVSGTGFAGGTSINIYFDGNPVASTTSTAAGSIPAGITFPVPIAVEGSHSVSASDGLNSASASFTVTPSITLNPTSGNVGSTVSISGTGFAPSSFTTITFGGSSVTTITTTALGEIPAGTTFSVPEKTAGGHTVLVTDGSSNSASASYTVVPLIVLNPTSGANETIVTITGSGFAANSLLTVTFEGNPVTFSVSNTNADGSFNGTFTASSSTTGSKVVVVSDASSNSDSDQFLVT